MHWGILGERYQGFRSPYRSTGAGTVKVGRWKTAPIVPHCLQDQFITIISSFFWAELWQTAQPCSKSISSSSRRAARKACATETVRSICWLAMPVPPSTAVSNAAHATSMALQHRLANVKHHCASARPRGPSAHQWAPHASPSTQKDASPKPAGLLLAG